MTIKSRTETGKCRGIDHYQLLNTVPPVQEMKRALFIFAKLNPGLRYVQGMNELLAPLYYHFRMDPDREAAAHAEADAFFCFMDIISEFRDNFCQQLVRCC